MWAEEKKEQPFGNGWGESLKASWGHTRASRSHTVAQKRQKKDKVKDNKRCPNRKGSEVQLFLTSNAETGALLRWNVCAAVAVIIHLHRPKGRNRFLFYLASTSSGLLLHPKRRTGMQLDTIISKTCYNGWHWKALHLSSGHWQNRLFSFFRKSQPHGVVVIKNFIKYSRHLEWKREIGDSTEWMVNR